MRVLTVRQPYAWAIIHGGKDIENRSRNIAGDYRGPIAVHAGLAKPEKNNLASRLHASARGGETDTRLVFGAVIGVVDLVDVRCTGRYELGSCGCSPWATPADTHLVLANPRPFATPIPAKGRLGLWRPDTVLAAQIETALAGEAR